MLSENSPDSHNPTNPAMKTTTLLLTCLASCLAFPAIAMAAEASYNDASLINDAFNYSDFMAAAPYGKRTGTGGIAPSTSGGLLTYSMQGATGNMTDAIKTFGDVSQIPLNVIVTVRAAVDQFPDMSTYGPNYLTPNGITLVDVRFQDTTWVQVMPTYIRVGNWSNGGNGTTINVATEAGKFYTWQFEISQAAGSAAGTGVSVYRRESDKDAWSFVGTSVVYGTEVNANAYQVRMGSIAYNGEGNKIQGIMRMDYFQLGVAGTPPAIPEPTTISLLLSAGVGLFTWTMHRRLARRR